MEYIQSTPANPLAFLTSGSCEAQIVWGSVVVVAALLAVITIQPTRTHATVTDVFIYPIKSCAGIRVENGEVDNRGLVLDRRFMIVKLDDGSGPAVFQSQRVLPRMALLHPRYNADEDLVISTNDGYEFTLDVVRPSDSNAVTRKVRVWDSVFDGTIDQGDDIAEFLCDYLHTDGLRLVHMPESCTRDIEHKFRASGSKHEVSFADGFPLLVISQESLDEYARASNVSAADVRRFRPNIVVKGACRPNDEDTWKEFTIGANTFFGVKQCTRCKLTTVNPDTGSAGSSELEPLKTLRKYRLRDDNTSVTFGMNATPKRCRGTFSITVGDALVTQALSDSTPYK